MKRWNSKDTGPIFFGLVGVILALADIGLCF